MAATIHDTTVKPRPMTAAELTAELSDPVKLADWERRLAVAWTALDER